MINWLSIFGVKYSYWYKQFLKVLKLIEIEKKGMQIILKHLNTFWLSFSDNQNNITVK